MISANTGAPAPSLDARARDHMEMLRLAVAGADECYRSDIECFAAAIPGRKGWWDIAPREENDPYEVTAMVRAARYLSLRGKLDVDPVDALKVRPLP